VEEATRLVDICLEAGLTMFDSADVYSDGLAEEILGQAIKGRRDQVLISTKAHLRTGPGPNDAGSSRHHLLQAPEMSLRRMETDYVDLFQLHGFDAFTPIEETLGTLSDLVRSGKIRYIDCSNFAGWHLMKSLGILEKYGLPRYVAHQAYYSLIGRDYEWELMPLTLDQEIGTIVWSPLGWGRLTGRFRRGEPKPETSRLNSASNLDAGPPIADEHVFKVVDALDEVSQETGKTDRAQLAPSTSHRGHGHHRRTQRRAASPESRRHWLEPRAGTDRQARFRQRPDSGLSVLALLHPRRLRRAQPPPHQLTHP
jgi:aryl-alcohol dehydrogenase-like predicted oxidoreductase